MLTTLFKSALGAGLSLIPLMALLLLALPRLRRRYTPGLPVALWLVLSLRLLLPVPLGATARFFLPAGRPLVRLEGEQAAVLRAFAEAGTVPGHQSLAGAEAVSHAISWWGILAMVWLAGVVCLLACQLGGHLLASRRLGRWSMPAEEPVQALAAQIQAEVGAAGRVEILRCPGAATPMLIGFARPRILLPEGAFPQEELACVLRHELTHLRRGDLWTKLVLMLARCVHWYNPLVHLMARQAELDVELACDARVLRDAGAEARRSYGFALLAFLGGREGGSLPLTTHFSGGAKQMVRRFSGIVDTARRRRGRGVIAAAVAAVLACGALVGVAVGEEPTGAAGGASVAIIGGVDGPTQVYTTGWTDSDATAQAPPLEEGALAWPVPGHYTITSPYGYRFEGQDFHTGIDISGEAIYGADVVAAAEGTVIYANTEHTAGVGYGIYIIVDHGGGLATLYAHLSAGDVQVGDRVAAGQRIGRVGATGWSTGPVLQFEVRQNGAHTDPAPFLTGYTHAGDA